MDQPVEVILDHGVDLRGRWVLEGVAAQLLDDRASHEQHGAEDPPDEGGHQEDEGSPPEAGASHPLGAATRLMNG